MAQDPILYDQLVENALRGVVREALAVAARDGLPGTHHFYVSFRTDAAGVVLPDYLRDRFPGEMTIVLQHQFWGLVVEAERFSVALSFQGRPEKLTIPFAAVSSFADPSVEFGLRFGPPADPAATAPGALVPAPEAAAPEPQQAEIVTLDKFRKR